MSTADELANLACAPQSRETDTRVVRSGEVNLLGTPLAPETEVVATAHRAPRTLLAMDWVRPLVAVGVGILVMAGVGAQAAAAPAVRVVRGPVVPGVVLPPDGRSDAHESPQGWAPYPIGIPDTTEPSGMAPPGRNAFHKFKLTYVTDFAGSSLPKGWFAFTGTPGGDPGAQWAASHVSVTKGMLLLRAYRDPAYGDEWVTGGVCQCRVSRTYGAYFVRSRVTGPGPTQVEMLWPTDNSWPPEVDFSESWGDLNQIQATNHYDKHNPTSATIALLYVNLTKWHTFGLVWSPTQLTYIVDGKAWAKFKLRGTIPSVPMTLDLTQQTWCSAKWACPTKPENMQVDWVAEYGWHKP